MPRLPYVRETYTQQVVTDQFMGYNHNMKIMDGEFYDMRNLTSDNFPLMSNRRKRSVISTLVEPKGMVGKAKLAYIDDTSIYYGGADITEYLNAKGFFISSVLVPKQLVSMGAYICIFPDKLYINTENYTDCGSMEALFSSSGNVEYTLCKIDGTDYGETTVSSQPPEKPENNALWIDTSNKVHVLNQYSASTASWVSIASVYVKIKTAGIGKQFKKYDGVHVSGCHAPESDGLNAQFKTINSLQTIWAKDDDYIVVTGLIDYTFTQTTGTVSIKRLTPDMDYVTEAENRIWGCKYGQVNGKTVNEIYCCALGDFKNWEQYQGISTDSYRASVGTDGVFTGAITHLGFPIFFKEHCLHKVYISPTGAHQIRDTACRGVQKGSNRSLVTVGETLYYKSINDICAYDGALPVSVSEQLGNERYYEGVGGVFNDKYYICMKDGAGKHKVFVYDTRSRFWHVEDEMDVKWFASCNGELYFINSANELGTIGGSEGTPEGTIKWSAQTGLEGYETVEQKYVSRFNIRMKLPEGSEMTVYIEYDSDGEWHECGTVYGTGTNTFLLPVRPRRCDHFRVKLEGTGDVKIYSIAKVFERGSDVDEYH